MLISYKKNTIYLILLIYVWFINSCDITFINPQPKNKSLTYYNIIIISDLSDRIDSKINGYITNQQYPPKDIMEIQNILTFFKEECVKPGVKIGDKSSISFYTSSSVPVASIDLSEIKNLLDKQEYVNSTGKYKDNGLNYDIELFDQAVQNAYANIRNDGLDLISTLVDKIENSGIIKENEIIVSGIDSTFINYENRIYIFTDGYLEYKGKNRNGQFYFGNREIEEIRKYSQEYNIAIATAINKNESFNLPPVNNDKNHLIDLYILETHERDKDNKFQSYINPKGYRDNEILEEVWRKWANDSGFNAFHWNKY